MIQVDSVNGLFEMSGGFFVLLNVLKLHHDKLVKGVNPIAVSFFAIWGYWNLYYYAAISQTYSLFGSASVAIMNTVWLCQLAYYSRLNMRLKS